MIHLHLAGSINDLSLNEAAGYRRQCINNAFSLFRQISAKLATKIIRTRKAFENGSTFLWFNRFQDTLVPWSWLYIVLIALSMQLIQTTTPYPIISLHIPMAPYCMLKANCNTSRSLHIIATWDLFVMFTVIMRLKKMSVNNVHAPLKSYNLQIFFSAYPTFNVCFKQTTERMPGMFVLISMQFHQDFQIQ